MSTHEVNKGKTALITGIVLTALAALLFGYQLWTGIGNALVFPEFAASIGLAVNATGWFWITVQIALPIIVAALALLTARKRGALVRGVMLLAGVALVSVALIDIMHLVPNTSYFS